MNLQDKSVVITGGSRGLGRALAFEFASRGARLALVARGEDALEETARELRAKGHEVVAVSADMGDKQAIHRISGEISAKLGTPDILIHNASTLGPTPLRLLLDTECEDFGRALEVNTLGPFRLSKAFAGAMVLRGSGLIVHLSSDAAVEAYPRWGAYSVSKAATDHLSRILAAELADSGIAVLSVDPGEMNTQMHAQAVPDADPAGLLEPSLVAGWIVEGLQRRDAISGLRVNAQELRGPA